MANLRTALSSLKKSIAARDSNLVLEDLDLSLNVDDGGGPLIQITASPNARRDMDRV